jgi:hypothetical protein
MPAPGETRRALALSLTWRELALAAAAFLALTVVMAAPLSLNPASHALALSADTRLFLWTISWDTHALLHQPWAIFDANIFWPEPRTLAYSEHLIGSSLLGAPALLATGNPVLALNVIVLLSCVLSGLGSYVLARQLRASVPSALAAGIIFAFSAPRFVRLAQVHLATVQYLPFALAFLHRYLEYRRRRDLMACAALFTLQALTSGHGGLFLLLAVATLALYAAALGRLPGPRRLVRDLGWPGAALVAANALMVLPYARARHDVGLHRTLGAVYDWAPNAWSFLASPAHAQQFLLGLAPGLREQVEKASAYMFPGWLPLLLAALVLTLKPFGETVPSSVESPARAGLGNRIRRRLAGAIEPRPGADGGFYLLLLLLSTWASLGPGFGLYTALYRLLPGFDLIRVPSRLAVLTLLAVAVLAALGLERLLARLQGGQRAIAGAAAVVLLLAELAAFPVDARPYTVEAPAIDRALASEPKPFAAVELPVAQVTDAVQFGRLNSRYMLHSMLHWQPIVNGYSGIVPPRHEQRLFPLLASFPDPASLSELEALGVRYAVLHRELYGEAEWAAVVAKAGQFPNRLRLEAETPDGRLYFLPFARQVRR